MVRIRAQKVAGIAADNPELAVDHDEGANLLVLGWGGTYGPITAGVRRVRKAGGKVSQAHLRHLNPFPRNLGDVLRSYDRVLIPEMNLGQLLKLVRAEFLVDAAGYNRVRGLPFSSAELAEAMEAML
jgi:2-oxoglutarate ferredoxin oxidoreductase subunit alpha